MTSKRATAIEKLQAPKIQWRTSKLWKCSLYKEVPFLLENVLRICFYLYSNSKFDRTATLIMENSCTSSRYCLKLKLKDEFEMIRVWKSSSTILHLSQAMFKTNCDHSIHVRTYKAAFKTILEKKPNNVMVYNGTK